MVFGNHLGHLAMRLEKCRTSRLSHNLLKCAFGLSSDMLLGHIISKNVMVLNPAKVKAILDKPTLTNRGGFDN